MIDLTTNNDNKKDFILDLKIDNNFNNIIIKYATGEETIKEFSIDDFNYFISLMEKQFISFKNSFKKYTEIELIKNNIKMLMAFISELIIVYNINNLSISWIKDLLFSLMVIGIYSFYLHIKRFEIDDDQNNLKLITLYDEYLKNKEYFTIDIVNPLNGDIKKFYLITLANIDEFSRCSNIEDIKNMFNNKYKEQLKNDYTKKLF